MALVAAYGSSDDEDDAEELATAASPAGAASAPAGNIEVPDSGLKASAGSLPGAALILPPPAAASGGGLEEEALEDFVKAKKYGGGEHADASRPPPGRGPLRLPAPKSRGTERQAVRITAPALSAYDSDEDDGPSAKKSKASATSGGSGLLSLLPQPKNCSVKDLIPQSLARAAASAQHRPVARQAVSAGKSSATAAASGKQLIVPTSQAQNAAASACRASQRGDDEGGDVGGSADFFSLDSPSAPVRSGGFGMASTAAAPPPWAPPSASAPAFDSPKAGKSEAGSQNEVLHNGELSASPTDYPPVEYNADGEATSHSYSYGDAFGASSSLLADEQFLRMQGKKQRGKEDVQIVDVSEDDFRASQLELTKSLSQEVDPRSYSHRKKGEGPSSVEKKKHQITYLAYQAKERELELKNAWASSRATRQQTQSKYGF